VLDASLAAFRRGYDSFHILYGLDISRVILRQKRIAGNAARLKCLKCAVDLGRLHCQHTLCAGHQHENTNHVLKQTVELLFLLVHHVAIKLVARKGGGPLMIKIQIAKDECGALVELLFHLKQFFVLRESVFVLGIHGQEALLELIDKLFVHWVLLVLHQLT
jgi:hypothetical protein